MSMAQRRHVRKLRIKDMRRAMHKVRICRELRKLSGNAPELQANVITKVKVMPFAPPTFAKLTTAVMVEKPGYGLMMDVSKEYEKVYEGNAIPSIVLPAVDPQEWIQ